MGDFGKRFRECRKLAGLKQTAAARAMGISQAAISQYENDEREPTAAVVIAMARTYGVSIDYLLGVTDVRDGLVVSYLTESEG